ncbi:MAG: hypothetical protein HQ483_19540 [Rhodospirillales bacterium]|nr:hypothetical protein [Rhodospirillales bacterium]
MGFFLAAHGLQGLHAFLAAQGLHGLHAFLAAQGLHGLHAFLAAQGLQAATSIMPDRSGAAAWAVGNTLMAPTPVSAATPTYAIVFLIIRLSCLVWVQCYEL